MIYFLPICAWIFTALTITIPGPTVAVHGNPDVIKAAYYNCKSEQYMVNSFNDEY